jgi:type VI secretion system protein ImpA
LQKTLTIKLDNKKASAFAVDGSTSRRFSMSSAALLDFPALLAPLPGDDPAGAPVPPEIRQQLEDGRKEDDPEDDSIAAGERRKADWPGIVRLAQQTLTLISKDLLVAARLTEALVRLHGFAGLRDGLHLLRQLVEQCWDRLRPPIEDGDVEIRAAPFDWLDAPDKGARLPATLRTVPLVFRKEGNQVQAYGWLHWENKSKDPRNRIGPEDFEAAILATPLEDCEAVATEIAQGREELRQLALSLGLKLGTAAPGLTGTQQALDNCHALMEQILARKRPVSLPDEDISEEHGDPQSRRAPGSRAAAYRQLAQAAAVLRELEPHSPIPYLIQRAVELGALPFPQLIKALVRDANVLSELNRELGIQEPSQESSE